MNSKDLSSEDKNKVSAFNLVLLNNTVKNDTNVTIDKNEGIKWDGYLPL